MTMLKLYLTIKLKHVPTAQAKGILTDIGTEELVPVCYLCCFDYYFDF